PLRAARLLPLPPAALRLRSAAHRSPGAGGLRGTLRDRRHPPLAPRLPAPLLRQPVQARLRARRPEGRVGRLALAARRLAYAGGRLGRRVAGGGRGDPRGALAQRSGAGAASFRAQRPSGSQRYWRSQGLDAQAALPLDAVGDPHELLAQEREAFLFVEDGDGERDQLGRGSGLPRPPQPPRKTISPWLGSSGEPALVTRYPGITRMWYRRMRPPILARNSMPLSPFTR